MRGWNTRSIKTFNWQSLKNKRGPFSRYCKRLKITANIRWTLKINLIYFQNTILFFSGIAFLTQLKINELF